MKIEHVALYVNNLVEARNFFVKYLSGHADDGYHNSNTGFRSYFISFDDGSRLEIMSKPDMVDIEKELERIAKELEKARKNLSSLEGKLSNENFVSRAPEHVVADIREKAQKAKDLITSLEQSEAAMKKL